MSASCELAPVIWRSSLVSRITRPSRPVAPITKTRINSLFVLEFPVVGDVGMVVLQPAFVFRVVVAVGHVNQRGRLRSQRLVAVTSARRYQEFPRLTHGPGNRM